ncbi:MAG: TetR family transcriptional regulator [Streptosporangiales bacterium]|nr:TetR family transcriptional regulator [Streptosporangiales bacterium]
MKAGKAGVGTSSAGKVGDEGWSRPRRRRQELIDAAAVIFSDKGYDAASIQEIADALGILKGSVYYYIDSKQDLLFEIISERQDHTDALVKELRRADLDPLGRLRAFITEHVEDVMRDPVKSAVMCRDFEALTGERRAAALKLLDRRNRFLRQQVVDGQGAGIVCPDVDPNLALRAVTGMVSWAWQWSGGGRLKPALVGNALSDMVLAGITCHPRHHSAGHRALIGALPAYG